MFFFKKKNKIVLIDEATANIDIQNEQILLKIMKNSFQECTVITIAHRLNTILESDRILLLEEG
jgi:ABC-type transport system involved in cytochrome bd biosynthesis fused ATPase/permease subunit